MVDVFDQAAGDIFDQVQPDASGVPRPTVRRPPNLILQASEEPGLLTGPIDTQSNWTAKGGDPAAQQVLAREVKAGVDTIAGIPSAIYHAAVDKPTEEEADFRRTTGSQRA